MVLVVVVGVFKYKSEYSSSFSYSSKSSSSSSLGSSELSPRVALKSSMAHARIVTMTMVGTAVEMSV